MCENCFSKYYLQFYAPQNTAYMAVMVDHSHCINVLGHYLYFEKALTVINTSIPLRSYNTIVTEWFVKGFQNVVLMVQVLI